MTPREIRRQRQQDQERQEALLEMYESCSDQEDRNALWSDLWAETNGFESDHSH